MTYLQSYLLAQDPQLWQRLVGATVKVCVNFYTENPATAGHDLNVALVNYAGPRLADFERFAKEIALLLVILNPTISTTTADADLVTMLKGIWPAYAAIMQAKGLITVAVV